MHISRKLLFASFVVIITFLFRTEAQAFTYVTAVICKYDAKGNRILRKIDTACIDCPYTPTEPDYPSARPQGDTITTTSVINAEIEPVEPLLLLLYPNPTHEDIVIENKSWKVTDKAKISVFDIAGRKIFELSTSSNKEQIKLAGIPPGIYQVHYYINEKFIQIWKVVKQ